MESDSENQKNENSAESKSIPHEAIGYSREDVAGIIGLICYSHKELRDDLAENGFNEKNLPTVKEKIALFYKLIGKEQPNLDWMDTVTFKVLKNDDNNFTIPLPHQED